MKKSTL